MEQKINAYRVDEIIFPKIIGILKKEQPKEWDLRYSIVTSIKTDTRVELLFGIQVIPTGTDSSQPDQFINIEALGIFSFDGGKVPSLSYVEEIPLIQGLLAALYPYLREKVHYIFYSNKMDFHLPSVNLIGFLNNNKNKFKVTDERIAAQKPH